MPKGLQGFQKGNKLGLGRIKSPEEIKKISKANKGRKHSTEQNEFNRQLRLKEWRENPNRSLFVKGHKINVGRKADKITGERIRQTKIGKKRPNMSGKNHFNWKGGITSTYEKIRKSIEYKNWRDSIYKRDNWTCQECEAKGGNGKSIYLEAHHIKEFYKICENNNIKTYDEAINCKELWNIRNGITLCQKCHNQTKLGIKR